MMKNGMFSPNNATKQKILASKRDKIRRNSTIGGPGVVTGENSQDDLVATNHNFNRSKTSNQVGLLGQIANEADFGKQKKSNFSEVKTDKYGDQSTQMDSQINNLLLTQPNQQHGSQYSGFSSSRNATTGRENHDLFSEIRGKNLKTEPAKLQKERNSKSKFDPSAYSGVYRVQNCYKIHKNSKKNNKSTNNILTGNRSLSSRTSKNKSSFQIKNSRNSSSSHHKAKNKPKKVKIRRSRTYSTLKKKSEKSSAKKTLYDIAAYTKLDHECKPPFF